MVDLMKRPGSQQWEPTKREERGPSVILCGRLADEPRVKVTPEGVHIAEFRVMTNDWQEPDYHVVRAYSSLAALIGEYLRKGSQVLIEGHLLRGSWKASSAYARRRVVVIGESMRSLSSAAS